MKSTRINRYLAEHGICSRRKADTLVEEGKVFINGKRAVLGQTVEESDAIEVEGRFLGETPEHRTIAYHKPIGVITTVDPTRSNSVVSRLGISERLFPIGRLDVASSGLLLLTNDGDLAEAICHPRYEHEKEYEVEVDKPLTPMFLSKMSEGVMVLGKPTKHAMLVPLTSHTFRITLTEGRNRQIRRMCEKLGYDVRRLIRIRVMNILLGRLAPGQWRDLTKKEMTELKKRLHRATL